MRLLGSVLLTVMFWQFAPIAAFAHALHIECAPRGDHYIVETFYEGNEPAGNAIVRVLNADKQVVYSGTTNAKGFWSFSRPAPGKYTVTAATTGHRKEIEIDVPAAANGNVLSTPWPEDDVENVGKAQSGDWTWLKVTIGLITIGGLSGTFLLVSMLRKKGEPGA